MPFSGATRKTLTAGSHVSDGQAATGERPSPCESRTRPTGRSVLHRWFVLPAGMAFTGLLLSGCASISEKDCLRGDWQTVGFEDGRAGRSSERLQNYADDCGDYDVRPDPMAYSTGYDAGIRQYCTVDSGLDAGELNADYEGVCPADIESAFLDGYLRGLDLARENLQLAYERLALDLDVLRDQRDAEELDGSTEQFDDLDDEIEVLQSRLSANSFEREDINRKIARWNRQLQ